MEFMSCHAARTVVIKRRGVLLLLLPEVTVSMGASCHLRVRRVARR